MTLEEAASGVWDVAVAGAGPSGALAARQLVRQGFSVLLIDKAVFPRRKVCGCCLNAAALGTLQRVGLGDLATRLGARPLSHLMLAARGRRAPIPLPRGAAISREAFDAALVEEAVQAGARFFPEAHARLHPDSIQGPTRRLRLRQIQKQAEVEARIVLAADGLGGDFLQGEKGFEIVVGRSSPIGAGALVGQAPDFYRASSIFMACGKGGYVGLVQLEDGRLDVAAAFHAAFVRESGGPGPAAAAILKQAGLPAIEGLAALPWRGTPPLTRGRKRLGAHRLFVIGDAAGYVEPFTGEGIAWALACGVAATPLAVEGVERWTPSLSVTWRQRYRRLLGRRQVACRLITGLLRQEPWLGFMIGFLSRVPAVAVPFVQCANSPFEFCDGSVGIRA